MQEMIHFTLIDKKMMVEMSEVRRVLDIKDKEIIRLKTELFLATTELNEFRLVDYNTHGNGD